MLVEEDVLPVKENSPELLTPKPNVLELAIDPREVETPKSVEYLPGLLVESSIKY